MVDPRGSEPELLAPAAGDEGQPSPVPGDGSPVHATPGPSTAPEAGALRTIRSSSLTEPAEEEERKRKRRKRRNDEIDWEEILLNGFDVGGRRAEYEEREFYRPTPASAAVTYGTS